MANSIEKASIRTMTKSMDEATAKASTTTTADSMDEATAKASTTTTADSMDEATAKATADKKADTSVLLQHGWALDAEFWSRFASVLEKSSLSIKITTLDRGYFDPNKVEKTTSGLANTESECIDLIDHRFRITATHSFGLHLVPRSVLQKTDLLVVFGGFLHFHDGDDRERRLSRVAVRRMLQKLEQEPLILLEDFYANCGLSADSCSKRKLEELNLGLLKADLELLNETTLDKESLMLPGDVLLLAGSLDTIAPLNYSHELKKIRPDSTLQVHPGGTHALPIEHPEWCVNNILERLMVANR